MKKISILSGLWTVLLTISISSHAGVKQNALCYSQLTNESELGKVQGSDTLNNKYELASTSKVATTLWAIAKLGPNYRFPTRIYIMNRDGNKANIHIEGSRDPVFGREMIYLLTSELNKMGITEVPKFTFDENFKLFWNIRDFDSGVAHWRSILYHPFFIKRTLNSLAQKDFLEDIYGNIRSQSESKIGLTMVPKAKIKYGTVDYVQNKNFHDQVLSQLKSDEVDLAVLRSVPLYEQLKQMNLVSHNTIADMLFAAVSETDFTERNEVDLQSTEPVNWDKVNEKYTARIKANASFRFQKFMSENYNLQNDDIEFVNGSGDSEYGATSKIYNKASCNAMLVILQGIKEKLKQSKLDLWSVMAVSAVEQSTLGSRYAAFNKSVIAKTGTVNPAITLAGELSTKSGEILFAVLEHTDGAGDANEARNDIREEIGKLMVKFKNSQPVGYTPMKLYPFDKSSGLQVVNKDTIAKIQQEVDSTRIDDIVNEALSVAKATVQAASSAANAVTKTVATAALNTKKAVKTIVPRLP